MGWRKIPPMGVCTFPNCGQPWLVRVTTVINGRTHRYDLCSKHGISCIQAIRVIVDVETLNGAVIEDGDTMPFEGVSVVLCGHCGRFRFPQVPCEHKG